MKEKNIPIKRPKSMMMLIIVLFLFIGLISTAEKVNAATVETIPSTDLQVSSSNILRLGNVNYTAKWTGVSGKTIAGKYNYPHLCVPIKSKTSSFTYTDFLDITFTNIGSINGRQLDAKVHFNSMTVSARGGSATGERSDNYMGVCYLSAWSLWMSATIDDGSGYRAAKTIDTTTTVYWHDTGETVDLPFFQSLQDIDAGDSYYKEGWEAKSGFSGTFYKYSPCVLSFSGNKVSTPSNLSLSGTDSLLKGGFYAPTTGGTFRSAFYEGNCATQFNLYTQYSSGFIEKPTLYVDNSKVYKEGDNVIWSIKQPVGKYFTAVMSPYDSFSISDKVPNGVTYKSAKVLDSRGNDITSKGSLKYDKNTREVSFTFDNSFLLDKSNYNGTTYTLEITTTADNIEGTQKTIPNTGASEISSIDMDTNEMAITVVAPELSVQKVNTGKKYYTGETASYEVTFGQTVEGAEAENVVITDTLPTGLKLVSDSVKITGLTKSQYELQISSNQIKLSLKEELPYGEYTLSYEAEITADDIDQTLVNTASVTSTNADKKSSSSNLTILEIPKFMASYQFESADEDIPLPQEVIEFLPSDDTEYIKGNTVTAKAPEKIKVDVGTGKWEFKGYKDNSYVIDAANVVFNGVWKYTEYPAPLTLDKKATTGIYYNEDKIEYTINFNQDLAGIDAENVVLTDTLPKGLILDEESIRILGLESDQYKITSNTGSFTIKIPSLDYGKYQIKYQAKADTGRVTTDLTNTVNIDADNAKEAKRDTETVKINGQAVAEYKFISEDKDIELPSEVMNLIPEDTAWYKDGDTITAIEPSKKTVITDSGRWDFIGYDNVSVISNGKDVIFTGTWKLTEPSVNIDKSHEEKVYYRGDKVKYEIAFNQDTDKAYALNVTLADKIPEGEELIESSIEIKELNKSDYNVNVTDKGFGITIQKLSCGKYTLSYECEIDTEDKKQELVNVAGIKADNVEDIKKIEDTLKVSEIPKYVRYTFKTDNGSPVPKQIVELLPADENIYYDGDEAAAKSLSKTKIKVLGGTWEFVGWDKEAATFAGKDILFTGVWKFTADVPITGDSDFPYILLGMVIISGTCIVTYKKLSRKE